jgi:hypothetical protein
MRLSSLCLAAVLIFSPALAAQHSSGGGSSGGGSGGGGGSHTSSGGSGSSGGSASSHNSSGSSGGSVSHSSSGSHSAPISQGGSVHSSGSGIGGSRSVVSSPHSNAPNSIRQPNSGPRTKHETVGKKGFFSFLRRPMRRPQPKAEPKPKPVADLRGRLCFKGPCVVCPTGGVHGGGCLSGLDPQRRNNFCSAREIWNGGVCLLQTRFVDDCSGLRFAMERQAQRMQAAESAQQSACASAATQECSDLTNTSLAETSLYRALQSRYRQCRQSITAYPFGGTAVWSYASGLSFDGLVTDGDNR